MTKKSTIQYIRKQLIDIKPYPATITSAQLADYAGVDASSVLKLNNFENPMMEKFYDKKIKSPYFAYPDPLSMDLRKALSEYCGYSADWIACGNGSDELIDVLISLFVEANEEIMICPPTFPMYDVYARIRGIQVKKIVRDQNLELNLGELKKSITEKTKMIFIDSPGNPAGNLIPKNTIIELLEEGVIVVVDEAYFEYCQSTAADLLRKYNNLIVLRTFSKWAGLAGMRVGYMMADPVVVERLLAIKSPYNISVSAQESALFALEHKDEFLAELRKLTDFRDYMVERLSSVAGIASVRPGEAAFVILDIKSKNCMQLAESLKKQGILVKPVTQPRLENSLLVGLTNRENTDRLEKALTKILSDSPKK